MQAQQEQFCCPHCNKHIEGAGILDTVKAFIFGPTDLSSKQRAILKKYGGKFVLRAYAQRQPVNSMITKFLNVVTLGGFEEGLEKTPYDRLFHLSICFQLEDGPLVRVEKNEIIKISVEKPKAPGQTVGSTETMEIHGFEGNTLGQIMSRAKTHLGSKFAFYNSKNANCQDFILGILAANGIVNEFYTSWIKQEVRAVFETNPNLRAFNNIITGLGARVSTAIQGAGVPPNRTKAEIEALVDRRLQV